MLENFALSLRVFELLLDIMNTLGFCGGQKKYILLSEMDMDPWRGQEWNIMVWVIVWVSLKAHAFGTLTPKVLC